jgi:hypothetical protein
MRGVHLHLRSDEIREDKIERLNEENLAKIRWSLENYNLFTGHRIIAEEQMKVYEKIATMEDPVFVYLHQANMGDCYFMAIFKGVIYGKGNVHIVVQTGEDEDKPNYEAIWPQHIGKIRIIPWGKVVEWMNFEERTKLALWKDKCQYHPSSVEHPEWPGLLEL